MPVEIDALFSSPAVQAMKDFQRWWFLSLLLRGWQADPPCHLPNDHSRLWMLAGAPSPDKWMKDSAIVVGQFDASGDGQWLVNKRQLQIYEEKLGVHLAVSAKGKLGAEKRWHKDSPAIAQPCTSYSTVSDSSSPAVEVGFALESFDFEESFLKLHEIYPRRKDNHATRAFYMEAVEKVTAKKGFRRSEAAAFILSRAEIYVSKSKFIAGLDRFLCDGIYEQDESIWESSDCKDKQPDFRTKGDRCYHCGKSPSECECYK